MADKIKYVSNPVVQKLPDRDEGSKPKAKPKSDMTFSQAFAAARKEKGAGATFTWKGKQYTTDRADDKKTPSAAAKKPEAKASTPKSSGAMSNYARAKAARGSAESLLKSRGSLPAPKTRADKRSEKLEGLRKAAEAPGASRLTRDRYKMAKETNMYAKGGKVKSAKKATKGYASGGSVKASKRGDGIARKGKTRCKVC